MMGDQDSFCHKRRDEDVSGPAGGAVSIRTPERSAAGVTVTCADHRRAGQVSRSVRLPRSLSALEAAFVCVFVAGVVLRLHAASAEKPSCLPVRGEPESRAGARAGFNA